MYEPRDFLVSRLGLDPTGGLDWRGWLTLCGQAVLEVTAGEVYHDDDGRLTAARDALAWCPDDVWLVVLAAAWRHLAEDLPVLGHTATRGDAVGVLAGRVVEDLMRIGFLVERRWAPWSKWLATVFAALPRAGALTDRLEELLSLTTWPDLRDRVVDAVGALNRMQDGAGLPTTNEPVQPFFDRPYVGIVDDAMNVLLGVVEDEEIRGLPIRSMLGTVDQWCRDESLLSDPVRRTELARHALPQA